MITINTDTKMKLDYNILVDYVINTWNIQYMIHVCVFNSIEISNAQV